MQASDTVACVFIISKFRLECSDSLGIALEPTKLRAGMTHSCLTTFCDDSQRVVCTDVGGSCLRRVLGVECVSERTFPLFSEIVWLNADRMLDTNLVSVFFIGEFQTR